MIEAVGYFWATQPPFFYVLPLVYFLAAGYLLGRIHAENRAFMRYVAAEQRRVSMLDAMGRDFLAERGRA